MIFSDKLQVEAVALQDEKSRNEVITSMFFRILFLNELSLSNTRN